MIPKKSKEFIRPTAEKLNINEELVKDVIEFFYKKLRLNLQNLNCHNIYVPKLGTFMAKCWRIDDVIYELENKHNKLKPNTIRKYEAKKEYEVLLGNARMIKQMIEAEDLAKKTIKQKRRDEAIKKNQTNLEE